MKKLYNQTKQTIKYAAAMLVLATLLLPSQTTAQNQNSLYFDNVDDYISVPNASAGIAGSSQISMTLWVYPMNTAPAYPDFDGFAGFRNNVDADFYILQLTASSLEVRFRNSAGTVVDIVSSAINLNAWNHYVLTYDGSKTRLYHNGVATDSMAATGTIASATETFYIGETPFTSANFNLNGMEDEVSLWNHALTPAEVNCIYHTGIDSTNAGLQAYYKFNNGVAGGTNTTLTTLTDASSHALNGTLNNLALTGTTSNYVAGVANYGTASKVMCSGAYTFHGQTFSTPGTYYVNFHSVSVCDSTVQLTLTQVDTSVTVTGGTFHANQSGVTYQWVNCATNTAVAGAASQNFLPTANGSYKCVVNTGTCTDTSACYSFTHAGINENSLSMLVHVFPNPATDNISISTDKILHSVILTLFDITGKEIMVSNYSNSKQITLNIAELNSGFYFLQVASAEGKATFKVVKK